MKHIIKSPDACTEIERAAFLARVIDGGEVASGGLSDRVRRAEALLFLLDDASGLVGVSAIKRPHPNYRANKFAAAKTSISPDTFSIELGWVYLIPAFQGRGLSSSLVDPLMAIVADRPVFATTRQDNDAMHHILPARGFRATGSSYRSENGAYEIDLFVRGDAV